MFCPGSDSNPKAVSFRLCSGMADRDPELERLLKAERLAFERYDRLRGYPGDVQEVALAYGRKQLKQCALIARSIPRAL
jgi:hypothetical protein